MLRIYFWWFRSGRVDLYIYTLYFSYYIKGPVTCHILFRIAYNLTEKKKKKKNQAFDHHTVDCMC